MLNYKLKNTLKESNGLSRAISILSKTDKRKILFIVFIQISMSIVDLIGVAGIGLLGAISTLNNKSKSQNHTINMVLEYLHISQFSVQRQMLTIGIGTSILLVSRTLISIYFTRRILYFMSIRGAAISADLLARLLSESILKIQARSTQDTLFSLTRGVEFITLGILAPLAVLISDFALLLIMGVGLLILDPITSAITIIVFLVMGLLLYRFTNEQAKSLGKESARLNIESNEQIIEVLQSYREAVVRNRRYYYSREIGKLRSDLGDVSAKIGFIPYVSKYAIEATVVLGTLLICILQVLLQDLSNGFATLAIFLAAGTRIAPAILRIQQGAIQIKTSLGMSTTTFEVIDSLKFSVPNDLSSDDVDVLHVGFTGEIELSNVSFTYPGNPLPALTDINLRIGSGLSVAIVGPSGAGKTTLIDVLLGVLKPDRGEILISEVSPERAVIAWPGAISYVPQDVVISSGSIRENVGMGYPSNKVTEKLVTNALHVSQLLDFVNQLPQQLDTQVGEGGAKMSGGQRQRLGIARAMFTCPKLLILDEATSSLDGEIEAAISNSINALRGSSTIITIAHRLSTVRNADVVIYMAEGKIIEVGTFAQVRTNVPDFDRQARLMGL
jgi:ABC-type multidrug transport system fused ATPase/permease subunit